MAIEIFDVPQNSPEWYACRLGIPTASMFGTIMAKGRGGSGDSKTRWTYMMKLLGERLTGEPCENYTNEHMERGKVMEAEARDWYVFQTDAEVHRVGFIRNGEVGCSPDSLIGTDGMLEIKTKLAHLQCEVLLDGQLPLVHKPQTQGQLWVAEREWVDFVSYWPKLKPFKIRAYRDEPYIRTIESAVAQFREELASYEERIRTGMVKVA